MLQNGDVVEVVRGAAPAVPPDWEGLTVTGRARSAIRRHMRHSEKEEFLRLGKAAIDQIFERAGKARAEVSLRPALDRFAAAGEAELFEAVGRGRISPTQVLEAVFPGLKDTEKEAASARRRIEDGKAARFYVRGSGLTPGVSLHFAPCCNPMPGDRIVGIAGEGEDLAVHTIDCAQLAQYEDREELWRDIQWTAEAERNTLSAARLHATIRDAPGVLGQACTMIGEAGGNIVGINMRHRHSDFFDVDFDVEVKDARHLTHIAAALRAPPLPSVESGRGRGFRPVRLPAAYRAEGSAKKAHPFSRPNGAKLRHSTPQIPFCSWGVVIPPFAAPGRQHRPRGHDPQRARRGLSRSGARRRDGAGGRRRRHHRPPARGPPPHLRRRHRRLAALTRRRGRPLNFEMAVTEEMEAIALAHRPHAACLVPERREEVTTEGGLDVAGQHNRIAPLVAQAGEAGIRVSLFIEADPAQIAAAHSAGAQVVELHTGAYCEAVRDGDAPTAPSACCARCASAAAQAAPSAWRSTPATASTTRPSRRSPPSPSWPSSTSAIS